MSVKLSWILNEMNRYQTIYTVEEQDKVRDLDSAIRRLKRNLSTPWRLKKSTLRVFDDVLEYPVASDHDDLAYIDNQNGKYFGEKARFTYTSLQQFYENPDDRNDLAEIFDNGVKYLGVRYKNSSAGSQEVSDSNSVTGWTGSGDAGTPVLDGVTIKEGNYSVKYPVVYSSGVATASFSFTAINDANYRQKYFFVWLYFSAVPTSVDIKFKIDNSNYLSKNITTQFSGQAIKADDWNLLAIDLNNATEVGTISSSPTFSSCDIIVNGMASGYFNVNTSYLRQWSLMDYWYYSGYTCGTVGSAVPNQDGFMASDESYSTDTVIFGDEEWVDVVTYDAILTGIADKENEKLFGVIENKRKEAEDKLKDRYPDMTPVIVTNNYRFRNDFNSPQSPYSGSNFVSS